MDAHANPEEMERFARNLKEFNKQLRASMGTLQMQFAGLGETWRDQEHSKFAQEFEQTIRTLNRFSVSADEHIPFLLRKAQHIRAYLNQR